MGSINDVGKFIFALIAFDFAFNYKRALLFIFETRNQYRIFVSVPIVLFSFRYIESLNSFLDSRAFYVIVFLIVYMNVLPKFQIDNENFGLIKKFRKYFKMYLDTF